MTRSFFPAPVARAAALPLLVILAACSTSGADGAAGRPPGAAVYIDGGGRRDAGSAADAAPDGPRGLTCSGISTCIRGCANVVACIQACYARGTPAAKAIFKDMNDCILAAMRGACQAACPSQQDSRCQPCLARVCGAKVAVCQAS